MAITDIGNQLSQQFMIKTLRNMMSETQRQSTTGKKSSTISGLGPSGASNSIAFRSKVNLLESYTSNLNVAKTRMAVMDSALSSITDTARDMLSQLRSQLQDAEPKAVILSDAAKTHMDSIADKLNTNINGRYLFSGDAIDSKPINDLAALNTNIGALVTTALTDPLTTTNSFITDTSAVGGAALGINNSTVFAGGVSMIGADNTKIDYTVKASDGGFSDIMRGMAIIANLPQPTTPAEQENYWDMVNSAIALLDRGAIAVDSYQGLLGSKAENVASLLDEHSNTKLVYEEYIGDVEDVDMAEAATKFSALKTQLETSYNIIAAMKDLSLINYI